MAEYHIYPLDVLNRITGGFDADCASDEAAFVAAKAMLEAGSRAEIWQGTRCVGQIPAAV